MKVHELLDAPEKWTKGSDARLCNGVPTKILDKEAVCWCLLGALCKCYKNDLDELNIKCNIILSAIEHYSIIFWNDREERTFEQVRDLCIKLDI